MEKEVIHILKPHELMHMGKLKSEGDMEDTTRNVKSKWINIGESHQRWIRLRDSLGFSLDSDLALMLLDSYEKFTAARPPPPSMNPATSGSASHQCPSCGFLLPQRCLQNRDDPKEVPLLLQNHQGPDALQPKEEPVSPAVSEEDDGSEGSGKNSDEDWIPHQHQTLTGHKKSTQMAVTVKEESEGSEEEEEKGENADKDQVQPQHRTRTRTNAQTDAVKEENEASGLNQDQARLQHRTRTLTRASKRAQSASAVTEESADRERVPGKRKLCSECGAFYQKLPHICEHKTKPFVCNICGKRCVSEPALKIHSGIHSETYEYTCKFCYINFKSKADKLQHELSHQDQKNPFQCRDCELSFASYKDRMKHIKQHRDDSPFKCVICGIVFRQRSRFLRHIVVHTGERAFKCPMCERGFNQKGHLESHMRLHTGERPYTCKHCSKSFNHNVSLKSHVQRYHQTEPEPEEPGHDWFQTRAWSERRDRGTGNTREHEEEEANAKPKKCRKPHTGRPKGRPKKQYPKMTDDSEEEEGE